MLKIKKCITISIITLKSYYLKTSKGISLLILPFIMISIFILQNNNRTQSDNLRLIVNSLVLVSCFSNINVLSGSIAYDRHFIRMKLYKSSNISFRMYIVGVVLPSIFSTLFTHLLIVLVSSLFFNVNLFKINIFLFMITSVFSSLSLIGVGIYIGFFTKDLVAAHTIANLITSILTFFGGLFFPINNLKIPVFISFTKIIPLTYISNSFKNQLLPSLFNTSNPPYFDFSTIILVLLGIISVAIILVFNLWRKKT